MRRIVIPILILSSLPAYAKTLTVAVIDTGIDGKLSHLCKMGHKSWVKDQRTDAYGRTVEVLRNPLDDRHGHGTHVAGLINRNSGNGNYCMVALQYYSDGNSGQQNLQNEIAALKYAIDIKVDYINISGGGPEFNEAEYLLIKEALDKNIKVVVAAGNGDPVTGMGEDLDKSCNYYPACYDKRLTVVGNLEKEGSPEAYRTPSSNYGSKVNRWEIGTACLSDMPGPGKRTGYMTGTSQATAVATGKLLRARLHK